MLRKRAAELEGNGELLCMPVVITASTRSTASSLQGTASGQSFVKDVPVRPLSETQMQAVIFDLAKRAQDSPATPGSLPPKLLHLLQLTGGNPRMLSQALCLLAGSSALRDEEFPAGLCKCDQKTNCGVCMFMTLFAGMQLLHWLIFALQNLVVAL